jgi:RHS repeat-associated protein
MLMPGRSWNSGRYRYGFNGKENDNEVKGDGNQQDYGMRVYDGRLGRFLSVDPLFLSFPWNSPYAFAENDVMRNVDLDGQENFLVIYDGMARNVAKLTIRRIQNIDEKAVENMQLTFTDGSKNDVLQYILRIQNNYAINGDSRNQYNGGNLIGNEKFITMNNNVIFAVEKGEIFEFVDDNIRGKIKRVAEGKKFSTENHREVVSEGFVAGRDFRFNGYKSIEGVAESILRNITEVSGIDEPKAIQMRILREQELDDVQRNSYQELLSRKFGNKLTVEWHFYSKKEIEENRKKEPNLNTNVTITVVE